MFKLVRFPSQLEGYFSSLTSRFHWEHHRYFSELVVLVAMAWGRRNISNLYRHLDERGRPHRSRFNNFALVQRWDPEQALEQKAYELLASLKPRPGERAYIILDDSKKHKRGKKMQGVDWLFDPTTGRKVRGHQYVMAVVEFRGHLIPFGVRLYVKKERCNALGVPFRKTTELAADLIARFAPPIDLEVVVLFDSYYLCPTVTQACSQSAFSFVSTLKNNRNLSRTGRLLKAGRYGRSLFRRQPKESLTIPKDHGGAHYQYVDAGQIQISHIGTLHVVYSRRRGERTIRGLLTNDPRLSAKTILRCYDRRWSIEQFFKDAKQLLGLGQYQNRSCRAAVTHLHLVCFAYALLTHLAIAREGAQGKHKRSAAARLSIAQLQNELRRIVWEDLTQYLKELPSGDQVIKELQRLLVA
jgi:hypothetical protein